MKPELILINPWIYDFAAYDLWSKPLGLLYIAAYLRDMGFNINFIDCLDIYHPDILKDSSSKNPKRRLYGTGKFLRQIINKPEPLSHINRSYSVYGIGKELFIKELKKTGNPSAILITSLMTYWYPGIFEVIKLCREVHSDVPIILGGVYSRLCEDHARNFSGVDYIANEVTIDNLETLPKILNRLNVPLPEFEPTKRPLLLPAYDLLSRIEYVCLLTSTGCPYRCKYCASHFLCPQFNRREPRLILNEIRHWHNKYGIRDFAFYDDALLIDFDNHMGLILDEIVRDKLDLRFHTPNAIHVKEISSRVATLLYKSGFKTLRLGLETSDYGLHQDLDNKVSAGEFERAVENLKNSGFNKQDIGTYILMGLPEQSVESVVQTIEFVDRTGANPYLAEYSPLPHTPLWEKAVKYSEYDLINEPLYHNNTLLPCWDESKRERVLELKRMVRDVRK